MYRSLSDSEVWNLDRYSKGQAWVDLLLLANHKPNTFFIRGIEMNLEIGQLAYSQVTLSKKWKWNRRTVNKFISWLEKQQMIHSRINKVCTVITILNYSKYQESTQESTQQSTQRVHNKVHTNKNDKNVKNILVNKLTNTSKRDGDVDFILEAFEKYAGHKTTDKSPRNIAYTFKRQVNKLIDDLKPYTSMEFKDTVNKSFAWYENQNELKAKSLNTVRRNITNILFENTRKKYIKEVKTP